MNRLMLGVIALTLPTQAFAWKHIYKVWNADSLPMEYTVAEVGEDSLPNPSDDAEDIFIWGYEAWLDAECSSFRSEYLGKDPENLGQVRDYKNKVSFDDPAKRIGAGVLAVTYSLSNATVEFIQDGSGYYQLYDADIVGNDNVDFTTDALIDGGECQGRTALQGTMTHEIGHLQGLGHSCDDGEICEDIDKLEATMFWTGGPCDTSTSTINSDDVQGITAIYGPYATFQCSHELDPGDSDTIAFGTVPFDLKCNVLSKDQAEIHNITWYWGDGASETSSAMNIQHRYETAGNFTLRAVIEGESATCGDWEYSSRRVGYVRACGEPEAEFSIESYDGLTYQFLNNTNVSVYGCIFEIQWDIFDSGGTLVDSIDAWEPKYTFPDNGEYRIVLNVGGPGGTGASELIFDAKSRRGEGSDCSVVASGATFSLFALSFGLVGLRRRRRS